MATYADAALAAYQAQHTAYLTAVKERLLPLMTDATGKVVLDPIAKTEVVYDNEDAGLVVLHTTDGSDLNFAVRGDAPVQLVALVNGQWQRGPEVASLADVGAVLAGES
jgi:hypothetical protein